MQARWGAVAGVLAALLAGAALLGGGIPDGAGAGSSAAGARARLHDGEERARQVALRAAAAEEAAAARRTPNRGTSFGEVAVEVALPVVGEPGPEGRRAEDSGDGSHDLRTVPLLEPDPVPVDGFVPDPGEVVSSETSATEWLQRHQMEDGSWDAGGLASRCVDGGCTDPGPPGHAVGDTGLALLAFFAQGETHKTPRYGKVVRAGLKHLNWIQDVEGCFGSRTGEGWLEDHALATLAMAHAYGLTQSPLFKSAGQNAVDFLESCRDPYLAWRYGAAPGPRDPALSAWALMAVKEAKGAGLEVAEGPLEDVMRWFEDRTDPVTGRVGTREEGFRGAADAPTAMGMLARIFAGVPRTDTLVNAGARVLVDGIPGPGEAASGRSPLFEYIGTLAMFQVGGEGYVRWKVAVVAPILTDFLGLEAGCAAGSSAPPAEGPEAGLGRVRTTALDFLTVAVLYRYSRCHQVVARD